MIWRRAWTVRFGRCRLPYPFTIAVAFVSDGADRGCDHDFTACNLILHADLTELWAAQQAMNRWWIDWCAARTAKSLDEPVRFRFIDGGDSTMTRGAILLHVVNHGTYHRGWVAEMFYAMAHRPPATDLPVFLRGARV